MTSTHDDEDLRIDGGASADGAPEHAVDRRDVESAGGATGAAVPDDPTGLIAPRLAWVLLVGGLIAGFSAFQLVRDRIELALNPDKILGCDINPILSCGSVMTTDQAKVFGFPNPLMGVAAFAGVAMIGAALLAGARFREWFWVGLQAGCIFGIGFVTWLQYQSIFNINALCPYCMVVWAMMIPIFVYVTRRNVLAWWGLGERGGIVRTIASYHVLIVIVWYVVVITIAIVHFWDRWAAVF